MALTEAQIESVREIAGESSYSYVETLCAALNASQETAMVVDLTAWDAVRSEHLKISGGKEGVDLDFERDRDAIRQRVRLRLGLTAMSASDIDSNSIYSVNLSGACWF